MKETQTPAQRIAMRAEKELELTTAQAVGLHEILRQNIAQVNHQRVASVRELASTAIDVRHHIDWLAARSIAEQMMKSGLILVSQADHPQILERQVQFTHKTYVVVPR